MTNRRIDGGVVCGEIGGSLDEMQLMPSRTIHDGGHIGRHADIVKQSSSLSSAYRPFDDGATRQRQGVFARQALAATAGEYDSENMLSHTLMIVGMAATA